MHQQVISDIHRVLKIAYRAVKRRQYHLLEGLSNQINHSVVTEQNKKVSDCAVAIYAMGKFFSKKQYLEHPDFEKFRERVASFLRKAIKFIKRGETDAYYNEILSLLKEIKSFDAKLAIYEEPLLIYARTIKARHAVEHGLSVKQASKLFDIAEWDISHSLGKSAKINISSAPPSLNKKRFEIAKKLFKVK